MTKMKSCIFSKIWRKFSLKNISKEKFFFFWRNIFLNLVSRFGKPQKFHDFIFISPEFNGVVLGENLSSLIFSHPQRFVGKKSFFKSHLPSKTFPSIYSQTFPNPIPDQSQSHQSLPLKTKIQFYQNFLPAKRSANHSMFFRRL